MNAASRSRLVRCCSSPAAAALASLAAVCLCVLIVGIAFVPHEARQARASQYTSITHYLPPANGQPAVALFWTIPKEGVTGWQHHLVIQRPGGPAARLNVSDREFNPLSLVRGHDDDHVLVGNWDGAIFCVNLKQQSSQRVRAGRQPDGGVVALAWSDAEQCVVAQTARRIFAWDVTAACQLWERRDIAPHCFAVCPSGQCLVAGTLGGELIELELATGRTTRTLAQHTMAAWGLSLDPPGRRLAVLQCDGRLRLLDRHSGAEVGPAGVGPGWNTASGRFAVFSPCERYVVTSDPDDTNAIAVWSIQTGQRIAQYRGHQHVVHGALFTTADRLCSWSADGTIRVWTLPAAPRAAVATLARPDVTPRPDITLPPGGAG